MFNRKRIKELETKVDLILDHLGLEYMPRLVEKDVKRLSSIEEHMMGWKADDERKIQEIDKDDLVAIKKDSIPRGMKETICKECKETFIQKENGHRIYCDKCKLRRLKKSWTSYEKKNPKRGNKTKNRSCKRCGNIFQIDKSSHRMYCDKCKKIRRKAVQKKSSRKYVEKKKQLKEQSII